MATLSQLGRRATPLPPYNSDEEIGQAPPVPPLRPEQKGKDSEKDNDVEVKKRQIKLRIPDVFTRKKHKVKPFFIQCNTYFYILSDSFNNENNKGMFAASIIRGTVGDWIELYVRDWLDNKTRI
jgi:hypothetical protein